MSHSIGVYYVVILRNSIINGVYVNVCIHDFDDSKDKCFSSLIQVKNSENNSQESQLFRKYLPRVTTLQINHKSLNSLENNSQESQLFRK